MVLKLYGFSLSVYTQAVMIVLKEKNVPFSFVPVDIIQGEHKSPEYLEKQPFGVVPYIDDDGFILYESCAICRYIATKYESQGPKLIPTDLQGAARFEQAASVERSYYNPHAEGIVWEKLIKSLVGLQCDEARAAEHTEKLKDKLEIYDLILSKQKYMAGDEFTLVDLFYFPLGTLLPRCGVHLLEEKPNVARWWKDISSRPSCLAVQGGIKV